ncbi:MAG: tyrosine recombinase XerC [Gemmiger sp.]|nr:tyrosine recombinase XerC [Gemmiger sp.]
MSSYVDALHPERHAPYLDIPDDVVDYLHYLDFVKQRSARTINGYYLDLRGFFRFMLPVWQPGLAGTPVEKLDLACITTSQIALISKRDIFNYLDAVRGDGNGPKARARKLSALRGFFKYMSTQAEKLKKDPTQDISLGAARKTLPKYLTRDESIDLLKNIQSDFYERDFCLLTLLLNCGMRLTELISINLGDFRDDTIRIIGKGSKERLVYLNAACKDALSHYLPVRAALPNLADSKALLVSKKTGKRLSARRVEQIVARCLQSAGLGGMGYSPHKLRHTAATLMYQYGNVDMLALKEILGHENVSTTQIYTHINQRQLQAAVDSSPLAKVRYHAPAAQNTPSQQDTGKKDGGASAKPTKKYRKK